MTSRGGATALTRGDRRALLVGAVVIPLLAIGSRWAPIGVAQLRARRGAARALLADVAAAEANVRALPAARDSLVARRVQLAVMDSAILQGATRAAAGATLAELVADAAEAAHTQLGAVQLEEFAEAEHSQRFMPLRVRASVSGSLAGVARMLAILEKGPALLAIRELTIAPSEAATPQNRAEILRVELVLEGLAQAGTGNGRGPTRAAPGEPPR